MFDIKNFETKWKGKTLKFHAGKIARQAAGAVHISYGETELLVAVTVQGNDSLDKKPSDISGLALMVNMLFKRYSTGTIPAGFVKREGKSSDREVLASRIVDRAIRPLIPEHLINEVNITCKLLNYDGKTLPEIPALIGASIALKIAGVPFKGPVAGVNICLDSNNNINYNEVGNEDSILELFIACTSDSVVMVESEASEISEERILELIDDSLNSAKEVIEIIDEFCDEGICKKADFIVYNNDELRKEIESKFSSKILELYNSKIKSKTERHAKLKAIYDEIFASLEGKDYSQAEIKFYIKEIERDLARENMVKNKVRIDGRDLTTVRDIDVEINYLKEAHGSALFTRGGTQALVISTLGGPQDAQVVDDIEGERKENVLLHYNFLPYAVGEVGQLKAPGRREIGHGKLALKAIQSLLPSKKEFPYTIRIVSEITESDGSSSMATVCGASLALMDTGVPIKKHVAGVAMGLVKVNDEYVVLTDISGDEDSLGDMDFKVAGTEDGVTALQMDIKISGISSAIIKDALAQAREARLHVIKKMSGAIPGHREEVKESAPKILCFEIPQDAVHKVIGSGGKTIKSISDETSSKIDIDANNFVYVMADTKESLSNVKSKIDSICSKFPPKIGEVHVGKIVSIVDFGLFVAMPNGQEGLVHISEIQRERINDIREVYNEGDTVNVRIKGVTSDGKIKLTMRLDEDRTEDDQKPRQPRQRRSFDQQPTSDFSSPFKGGDRRDGGNKRGSGGDRGGGDRGRGGGRNTKDRGRSDGRDDEAFTRRKRFF